MTNRVAITLTDEQKVRLEEGIPLPVDRLLAIATRELKTTQEAFKSIAICEERPAMRRITGSPRPHGQASPASA